jgi:hypothetical protein
MSLTYISDVLGSNPVLNTGYRYWGVLWFSEAFHANYQDNVFKYSKMTPPHHPILSSSQLTIALLPHSTRNKSVLCESHGPLNFCLMNGDFVQPYRQQVEFISEQISYCL